MEIFNGLALEIHKNKTLNANKLNHIVLREPFENPLRSRNCSDIYHGT